MSTLDKMKALKQLLGDKYYYYLVTMVEDGFGIRESVDYLYDMHFYCPKFEKGGICKSDII